MKASDREMVGRRAVEAAAERREKSKKMRLDGGCVVREVSKVIFQKNGHKKMGKAAENEMTREKVISG